MKKRKLLISDLYMILFSVFLILLTVLKVCTPDVIADEVVTFGAIYFFVSFIWVKIFTTQKPVFEQKRFLTKKERGILLVITFITELLFIIIDLFSGKFSDSWYWTIPAFIATDLLFFVFYKISKNNILTEEKDSCSDEKYIYISDEGVISDFNIGTTWYSRKKYELMRNTYLEIAKEYSGKKTYDEIEYMVRKMMAYKLRKKSSFAIYYVLAVLPFTMMIEDTENPLFGFILFSAMLANLYGVLRGAITIHNAFTPNESNGFSKEKESRQAEETKMRTKNTKTK